MRKCVNPDCGEIWDDEPPKNPCLKCGWTTVPYEPEEKTPRKKVKEADVN